MYPEDFQRDTVCIRKSGKTYAEMRIVEERSGIKFPDERTVNRWIKKWTPILDAEELARQNKTKPRQNNVPKDKNMTISEIQKVLNYTPKLQSIPTHILKNWRVLFKSFWARTPNYTGIRRLLEEHNDFVEGKS